MKMEFEVITNQRYELIDITKALEEKVKESGTKSGMLCVFVPHSTAGVILTENEPNLGRDWVNYFKDIVAGKKFLHDKIDDNADSHILSGIMGQSRNIIIENGKIIRGTWQNIFLAEFDGPKKRKILIKIIQD